MRTVQTTVTLICDNCRVSSHERLKSPIAQTWFRLRVGNNLNVMMRYEAHFCTEECGRSYISRQASFEEIPKNALRETLSHPVSGEHID